MAKTQLCWDCKNTNCTKCEWFADSTKYPDYVKVENGFICQCERFCKIDECEFNPFYLENYSKSRIYCELQKQFNVSQRTIVKHYNELIKKFKEIYLNKLNLVDRAKLLSILEVVN